ncbi:MAG TPA: hypothetical protein VE981_13090 [Planctomycetota bacterium]|nr:hypothetical protein [Planctomycetota bacterium]
MRRLTAALSVVFAVALAGCLDLDEEYSLNPDGSGKVKIKCALAPMRFSAGKKSPEELLKSDVRETLEKCEGVDAWTDVSAVQRDDGKIAFSGTAYFKDFSRLRLNILGMSSSMSKTAVVREGDAMTVTVTPEQRGEAPAEPAKLTEEQIQGKIQEERRKYLQSRPMIETFLKEAKIATRFNLPGAIGEMNNFKKTGDRGIELRLDGAAFLAAVDGLMKDDAFLRRSVESGRDLDKAGPPMDDQLMEKLFGQKGAIRAATKGALAPLFDYEAEAGKAREGMPELIAKYGAAPVAVAPPAGAAFKSVQVAGVQWVHAADEERGISPFSKGKPSFSVAITAELGGSALAVKSGKLLKAVSDDGQDLLPKGDFEREISFPRLSEDKTAITFDVALALPGPKAAGLKELSGTLTYLVADKTIDVDLGIAAFTKGAKGKAHDAEIEKAESGDDSAELAIKIALGLDAISSIEFYDEAGAKLTAVRQGYSSSGDESTIEFAIRGKLPKKGRIVAKLWDAPKTYEATFTVSNVDLLGRPKK